MECFPDVNIESGFFYCKHPQNMADMDDFSDRLYAHKKASFDTPLQSNHALVVTNYIRSYHDSPSPGTRELPSLIQQGTGHFFTMPRLVLKTPLQVGNKKWSQVWTGIMTSKDLPHVPPAPVVIKLFQESLFPREPYLNAFVGDFQYAEWFPGARLAANEAYAYDRMRAIQGGVISSTISRYALLQMMKGSFSVYVGRSVAWSYGFCKVFLIS